MEKRICRLTWNTNKWHKPSGHLWKKEWQGKNEKSYEQQHGYGHEEWLLNPVFKVEDTQFGFIQGISNYKKSEVIDELHLFTIEDRTLTRYYLGYLKNVQIINDGYSGIKKIEKWISGYIASMEQELKAVNADYANLAKFGYRPNVSFLVSEAELLMNPLEIKSKEFADRFFRFQPFKFTPEVENLIEIESFFYDFHFEPGGPGQKVTSYEKRGKSADVSTIEKFHNKIEKDLYNYLVEVVKLNENLISCGKTYIGSNIVDIAVKHSEKKFEFYEIKTTGSTRINIRAAIGQLLDYALWSAQLAQKLIIVSPTILDSGSIRYFNKLQNTLNIPIEFWEYHQQAKEVKERFKIFK